MDGRRIARVLPALGLLALAVLTVILFVAAIHKNSQITRLQQHGVAVGVRVSGCLGLLGGSGSNVASYSCRGTFTLDGHRTNDVVPGETFHRPGTIIHAVTVRDDPKLLETARILAHEHSSPRVYILPAILLMVLLLAAGALLLWPTRRRRNRSETP